ncbi:hypothetical protein [Aeromonas hydrophila]|uniref:hypothetical protein n=1 Tax=Aeromonas hydrophila TaxID=644 RepID=UPI001C5BC717|nr:hypothetical protein [Aeromonas hydrophila]MBW3830803.1 hypothetical protein [Aeromonas hydrophila]MBW5263280.1 hypothetical protein [Aeromonas hydrophila]MBW5277355.1 hypothetical protein [Aeromonas hydrophila]
MTTTYYDGHYTRSSGQKFIGALAVTTATVFGVCSPSTQPSSNNDEKIQISELIPASIVKSHATVVHDIVLPTVDIAATDTLQEDCMVSTLSYSKVEKIHSTLRGSSTLATVVMGLCSTLLVLDVLSPIVLVPAIISSFGVAVANGIQMNQIKKNYR